MKKNARLSSYDNFSPPFIDTLMQKQQPLTSFMPPVLISSNVKLPATPSSLTCVANPQLGSPFKSLITPHSVAMTKTSSAETFGRNSSLAFAPTAPFPLDFHKAIDTGFLKKHRSHSSSSTATAQTTLSTQSTVADSIICATNNIVPFNINTRPKYLFSVNSKNIYQNKSNAEEFIKNCIQKNNVDNKLSNELMFASSSSSLSTLSRPSLSSSTSPSCSASIFNCYSQSFQSNLIGTTASNEKKKKINCMLNGNSSFSEDNDDDLCNDNSSKILFLSNGTNCKRTNCNDKRFVNNTQQPFIYTKKDCKIKTTVKLAANNKQFKWPIAKQIFNRNLDQQKNLKKKKQKLNHLRHSLISTLILLFLMLFLFIIVVGLVILIFQDNKTFNLFDNYHQTLDYTIESIRKTFNTKDQHNDVDQFMSISESRKISTELNLETTTHSTNAMKYNVHRSYDQEISDNLNQHNDISRNLMEMFDPDKIRKNLQNIASKVHVAGTAEQLELLNRLENQYRDLNFEVESFEYEVLLSYPDYNRPNTIQMWNDYYADWESISVGMAERLGTDKKALDQQSDARSLVWWNAYSQNGTARGKIVYVNYGTPEDYKLLEKLNISLSGKIALIRYGALFRGEKALMAEEKGALGVILYSDPYDFAPDLAKNNKVLPLTAFYKTFPDKVWLPPSGAQRGTLLRTVGDPETPFLPSKPYVYRRLTEMELRKSKVLPNIPITSIGYRDALSIFKNLNGIEAPWAGWHGALDVPYRLTGTNQFELNVNAQTKRRKIKNFTAVLRGAEEPDKWVLLGNHADAWVQGAIDPGTATATMLEMARVLSTFAEQNAWRPRRTICFCQWDAEEFGLIGSTEWIEENLRFIENRAIAYINVDNINGNSTLEIKAVPLLYRVTVDAASRVKQPIFSNNLKSSIIDVKKTAKDHFRTLLDAWRFYSPKGPLPGDRSVPAIQLPGSGSDFQRFISFAGLPVADLKLQNAPIYSYMLYHSMYEIPWTVETFIDPQFRACTAMGQMWLELGRNLADSLLIPFNIEDYGVMLGEFFVKIHYQLLHMRVDSALGKMFFREKMDFLQSAIVDFQKYAVELQNIVQAVNNGDLSVSLRQVRMLNDRLQYVERAFILDRGLYPERSFFRHSVLTASENDLYSGVAFAIILDPAFKWWELTAKLKTESRNKNEVERKIKRNKKSKIEAKAELEHWLATVRFGFSHLQYTIESATKLIKLDGFFRRNK